MHSKNQPEVLHACYGTIKLKKMIANATTVLLKVGDNYEALRNITYLHAVYNYVNATPTTKTTIEKPLKITLTRGQIRNTTTTKPNNPPRGSRVQIQAAPRFLCDLIVVFGA
jgi:hypothetical protein